MKQKISDYIWGFQLAWKIDKKMLLFWGLLSIVISVFPALILWNYSRVLAILSGFLSSGVGGYSDISGSVVLLGILILISGLSARLNQDFLYMTMYDSFYLGLEEVMMEASQRISLTELVKKETGDDFFAAISRCGALTDLTSASCSLAGSIVSITSVLAVAASVSPAICGMAAAYVVFVVVINVVMSEQVRVVWKELREHLRKADYIKKLAQEGDTAKEVRIFRSIELLKNSWEEAKGKADGMQLRRAKGLAKMNLICQLGFYVFLAFLMGIALLELRQGVVRPDILLMLFMLGTQIADHVEKIPSAYQRLDYGIYGLGIQRRFFEQTPAAAPELECGKQMTPEDERVCFEAEHVYFSYPNGEPVLKDLSFSIHQGETVAIVGLNGSGKTTLLKLLMGLYRPTSGVLRFQGSAYEEYGQDRLKEKIGSFFQDFILFHLTVKENVGLGNIACMDQEKMVFDALKKGGALQLVSSWKHGIHQRLLRNVYRDGMMLSGGESQRIAVSRTHMSDKEILIFDEPASMLDPIAELEQFQHIKEKIRNHTAILVSHRIGFARLADRILVLNHGKIEEMGTHEELLEKNGVYSELFRQQAQWYDLSYTKKGTA